MYIFKLADSEFCLIDYADGARDGVVSSIDELYAMFCISCYTEIDDNSFYVFDNYIHNGMLGLCETFYLYKLYPKFIKKYVNQRDMFCFKLVEE